MAFSIGGSELTLDTVKSLTGLEVNHLVNVNFRGFAKAVQAIGCVYVDVDRRYYHSNAGLSAAAQYAEIDVRPGYQRLCGFQALQYVRFRHTDNDIVRAARQQDFLRQARARVPATKLFSDRNELIKIFTDYTSSDIDDPGTMLQVLKLFIEARDQPVKEVHFEGTVANRVFATPGQIEQAVSQFLGHEGSQGPRGESAASETGATPEEPPPSAAGEPTKGSKGAPVDQPEPAKKRKQSPTAGLETGNFGRKLAFRIRRRNRTFPVYYPGAIIPGSEYDQRPRAYTLKDDALSPGETFAYKFTLKTPAGEYYGMQGLRWKDAPILDEPHETREMGDRTYNLYYSNDRLRLVSWETDDGVYWVSNTLLQSLTAEQMIGIARGAKVLEPPSPPDDEE
jgi:LCP family protein required for cell wall assembly